MPLLLELFSGTGSIGKAFAELGWDVFSIDNDPRANASLCRNILDVTPEDIPGEPSFIWASPPCTQYSIARANARTPRDLEGSDALVRKTLDLIRFYQGVPYMIENPHSGLLKSRPVMSGIPMVVLDYCRYSSPYRKRTSIWTEMNWIPSQPLCKWDCPASRGRRHLAHAQQGSGLKTQDLHRIPHPLCQEIARFVQNTMILVLD